MTQAAAEGIAAAALVASIIGLVVGLAYYVWYAIALSKTFPKLASEGWKGWVPVLNEAEILRLGGVPAWSVIYYFIPILQLYGLYLKITAVHRINLQFQRGAGMTVLGILLPPVWASILAWGRPPASEFDQRVASMLPGQQQAGVGPLAKPATTPSDRPAARDASGYVIPEPSPGVSAALAPPPPPMAAFVIDPEPVAAVDALEPDALELDAVAPVLPDAAAGIEVPAVPAFIVNPWAPRTEQAVAASASVAPPAVEVPASIRSVSPPPVDFPSIASDPAASIPELISPPPPSPTPAPAEVPEPKPEPEVVPEPAVVESVLPTFPPVVDDDTAPPAAAAPAEAIEADDDDDDEFAATVVVDRRPRVLWRLVLDNGTALDLTADTVALGRNPASEDPDVQLLSVPDSTRTLSKTHATLELNDGQWTVTDLNSTNGVIVVGAEDAETLLAPGRSSLVPDRFILGKVGMRVEFDDGTAR